MAGNEVEVIRMVGGSTEAVGAGVGGGSSGNKMPLFLRFVMRESRSRSLRMESVAGMIGRGCGSSSWIQLKNSKKKKTMRKNDRVRVCTTSYSASSAVTDPYKTLRIQPGASESEVKKAFRQLALHLDEHFSRPMKEFVSLCLKKAPSEEKRNWRSSPFYAPFGGGTRFCLGAELARLQIALFLHYFVTTYRWTQLKEDRMSFFPSARLVLLFATTLNCCKK
ncbi:hypothetical protein HYC85_007976 [Camellia sinensis]|uniref:J domain-containing protein n=1 Tax=Camellia sinensis TaxID=4442 RepID=A0A7J7HQH1_CAMSI|nr:hypothetical protein HYC85_007976 [Camellia sinensis]